VIITSHPVRTISTDLLMLQPGHKRSFTAVTPAHARGVPCRHWVRKGECAFGDICEFSHEVSKSPGLDVRDVGEVAKGSLTVQFWRKQHRRVGDAAERLLFRTLATGAVTWGNGSVEDADLILVSKMPFKGMRRCKAGVVLNHFPVPP
jgi:hypothetical protein